MKSTTAVLAALVVAVVGLTAQRAVAASQAFTIRAVAGFETGLVKLAHIDDQLDLTRLVIIDYSGHPFGSAERLIAQGLLYHCEGLLHRSNCDVYGTVTYNDPGTHPFTVTYQPSGLFADRVTLTGSIVVKPQGDFVVVSIGDSVASGEGNPVLPLLAFGDGAYWDDFASDYNLPDSYRSYDGSHGCHRAIFAGPSQAAARLQQTNDVTFIHIACSGAKQGNEEAGDRATPAYAIGQIGKIDLQLQWVRERVPRIDVLVISAGANNVAGGFGNVVTSCLLNNPFTPCSEDDEFTKRLRGDIAALSVKYGFLETVIEGGEEDEVPSVVAITEYFDPTRDKNGDFPGPATSVSCGLGAISPKEWQFLYDEMVVPLNNAVQAAADLYGWVYVGGIADAFRTHGYCASPGPGDLFGGSWVVKFPESISNQGDFNGTAHPDGNGQQVYRDAIYDAVVRANPPRTAASATTDGQAYVFGTWVNTDVEVTLTARNPIRESGVGDTHYAPDAPRCDSQSVASGGCHPYTMPFTISESGRHVVSFFSTNQYGAAETHARPVEVLIDKEPPVMTCGASPDHLWPPNGRMVDLAVSVTAVDAVSGPADYWLAAISDSEGEAQTAVQDFALGTSDTEGSMLAARYGKNGDRTYTLTYESVDAVGNIGSCAVVVRVPHDRRVMSCGSVGAREVYGRRNYDGSDCTGVGLESDRRVRRRE